MCVAVSCWLADSSRSFLLTFRGPKWLGRPSVISFLNQIVVYISIVTAVLWFLRAMKVWITPLKEYWGEISHPQLSVTCRINPTWTVLSARICTALGFSSQSTNVFLTFQSRLRDYAELRALPYPIESWVSQGKMNSSHLYYCLFLSTLVLFEGKHCDRCDYEWLTESRCSAEGLGEKRSRDDCVYFKQATARIDEEHIVRNLPLTVSINF